MRHATTLTRSDPQPPSFPRSGSAASASQMHSARFQAPNCRPAPAQTPPSILAASTRIASPDGRPRRLARPTPTRRGPGPRAPATATHAPPLPSARRQTPHPRLAEHTDRPGFQSRLSNPSSHDTTPVAETGAAAKSLRSRRASRPTRPDRTWSAPDRAAAPGAAASRARPRQIPRTS